MEKFSKDYKPKISSTKSLAGHSLGATSVHESIYSLIMMKNNFIAASANIVDMDEEKRNIQLLLRSKKMLMLTPLCQTALVLEEQTQL